MRIAITGGSGSLGCALIRRLCETGGADRIVTITRDETKRARLQDEFGWYPGLKVYAGDVRDAARLRDAFAGCEAIIHAAARKTVTGHPDEAEEMLKTNILGTMNVIEAAREVRASKVLFISSDKAVHAEAQAYGLSKAMAERLVIAANARAYPCGTRLSVIRYGNCLASTGSVVARWRSQIANSEPINVSDERMTRFWLSLGQAVDYVLVALRVMRGGEIIVPHVPAAPLVRLAEAISTDGKMPSIVVTGIRRGGEKLHERLLSIDETRRTVRWQNMYIVPPDVPDEERWDVAPWLGEPVEPAMSYRSDVWEQASVERLREMLS